MSSARCNEFYQGLAVPERLALSEGLCVALLPQKQRMWTVSHHLFPVLSHLCNGAAWAGSASCPCWGIQRGTPALRCKEEGSKWHQDTLWDSHHPCLAWGSQGCPRCHVQQVVTLAWKHKSQPRQIPRLGQRRGRVSDRLPKTEISLERFKKWDYSTIRHLRTLECPTCIEFSLFD